MTPQGPWLPLLRGPTAERARAAVDEVCQAIVQDAKRGPERWNVSSGSAMRALLLSYRARLDGAADWQRGAEALLEHATTAIADAPSGPTLFYGFPGVLWCARHVTRHESDAVDTGESEEGFSEADSALQAFIEGRPRALPYELIAGLVGIGVHARARAPSADSARTLLGTLVDHLITLAVPRAEGVAWWTPADGLPPLQRAMAPHGYFNLGVAHGMPAVLSLLAQALEIGVGGDKARAVLRQGMQWLLAQQLPDPEQARFLNWTGPDVVPSQPRDAWCYGDPGIAVVLLHVARILGEPAWERHALELARKVARRLPRGPALLDPTLCHGAAGLAHLFNRLYQASGDLVLRDAALDCYEALLRAHAPGQGFGGWLSPSLTGGKEWVEDQTFLTGSTGIALALVAALSDEPPDWDSVLMANVPPRSLTP